MANLRLFRKPKLLCFGLIIAAVGYATPVTLTVDNSATTPHHQQTQDDRCNFGGSDCQPAAGSIPVAPPAQVPEPLTIGLTGAGLVGIYFLRRRRPPTSAEVRTILRSNRPGPSSGDRSE